MEISLTEWDGASQDLSIIIISNWFYLIFYLKWKNSKYHLLNVGYVYHDLEFSLSRDEIVRLLMTDKLYSSASLCVRELLQNALDALRYRRALFRRDASTDWNDGKVSFTHTLDEHGTQLLRCEDNGVGMDYEIVTKFLTSVGRSFYRSRPRSWDRPLPSASVRRKST